MCLITKQFLSCRMAEPIDTVNTQGTQTDLPLETQGEGYLSTPGVILGIVLIMHVFFKCYVCKLFL